MIGADGALEPCGTAYDHRVAGVVSGAGGIRSAFVLNSRDGHRAAIALMGTAYCKVDASSEAILAGDLLTTSATRGHAMKLVDAARGLGAILGKALRPLPDGRGLIPILLMGG
jgi:hypothetical protein